MPQVDNQESAFVQNDDLYNKKITPTVAPERKREVDLDNTLYNNIIEAGISSQLDITALDSMNRRAQDRNQMYNVFDVMCEDGTISAVIETYAEDATERNDKGNIVWVEANDGNIAQCVEYLLDTLNVNKNIYGWCHSLCKYGDLYLRLYRQSEYEDELFKKKEDEEDTRKSLNENLTDNKQLNEDVKIVAYSKNDNYAHYMEMVANPATMFELTRFGKTVGYVEAPVNNTIKKNENTTFTTFNYAYKFKRDDVTLYPATEFVHASLEDNSCREEETVSIFITEEDYEADNHAHSYKVKKGQSLLSNIYKIWRELQLLENSVLLNRITKSSIVRMINVEVGDMPKENVTKTLLGIKQMVEQKAAINQGNSMTEYSNPGPIENNIYVPTHEGVGTISTTQIGGDVDVKGLADLDYYMNKMYGQLRVPKQYFSQTDDAAGFNGGTSLSIISSRYAKMIKRIQNALIQAITDAVNLMLLDMELDSYVNEFTIHMQAPTTQEEIDRRDNLSSKVQLTSDIMNMLVDIEDPVAKLKILKSLISNVIDDTDVINILQEQVEKLEAEANNPTITEPAAAEESGGTPEGEDMGEFNDQFGDELGGDMKSDTEDENAEADDQTLPSPDDLGVDMSDSDEE